MREEKKGRARKTGRLVLVGVSTEDQGPQHGTPAESSSGGKKRTEGDHELKGEGGRFRPQLMSKKKGGPAGRKVSGHPGDNLVVVKGRDAGEMRAPGVREGQGADHVGRKKKKMLGELKKDESANFK